MNCLTEAQLESYQVNFSTEICYIMYDIIMRHLITFGDTFPLMVSEVTCIIKVRKVCEKVVKGN